jgi:hypothetical protein
MLLNRAADENFDQEGIYVSMSTALDDPATWSVPTKIPTAANVHRKSWPGDMLAPTSSRPRGSLLHGGRLITSLIQQADR